MLMFELFTIKSAYWLGRISSPLLMLDLSQGQVWKSGLHERLKMHLRRIATSVLPTKDVISQFANVEVGCPLCNLSDESSLHLFALYPIPKSLWFCSQWGVRTDSLGLPPFMTSLIFSSLLLLPRSLLSAKGKTSYFLELSHVILSRSREIFLFLKVLL